MCVFMCASPPRPKSVRAAVVRAAAGTGTQGSRAVRDVAVVVEVVRLAHVALRVVAVGLLGRVGGPRGEVVGGSAADGQVVVLEDEHTAAGRVERLPADVRVHRVTDLEVFAAGRAAGRAV